MTTSQLLDRFVELFNNGKLDEAEQDFATGATIEEVGTGRTFTVKQNTESARAWKTAFPDARGTITSKIVEGNKGAAEIVWRGTNTGSLMGQAPTRKSVTVRAVVVIETDGAKVKRSTHYIDVASMMAQLGLTSSTHAPV